MEFRGQNSLGYNSNHIPNDHGVDGSSERRRRRRDHQNVLHGVADAATRTPDQSRVIFQTTNSSPHDQNLYHHHHHQRLIEDKPAGNHTLNPEPVPDPDPDPISTTSPTLVPVLPTEIPTVRYRECLKNQAVSSGGHVVDGCGEFMPNGSDGTSESLKCAACECHRSFHRKETEGESSPSPQLHVAAATAANIYSLLPPPPPLPLPLPLPNHRQIHYQAHHNHRRIIPHQGGYNTPSTTQIAPMMMMNFGGGPAESSSEDLNLFRHSDNYNNNAAACGGETSGGGFPIKKRHRTKFSEEQKEKMLEFAEKIGWRIQKQDEEEMQKFCSQIKVKRQVFKVWMHNNKQTMKKKQTL